MDQDATRFGTEVDLGPGDLVLDGNQLNSPTYRGTAAPTFRPTLLWHGRPAELLFCFFSPLQFDRRMCFQLNSQ